MIKNLNYPIKYAVLKLEEIEGNPSNPKYITQGFIVSKCYVINGNIKYNEDGNCESSYKVVFPFYDIYKFKNNISKRNIPKENYRVHIVENIYDSYDEAKIEAEEKIMNYRQILLSQILIAAPNEKDYWKKLKDDFNKNLLKSYIFEDEVLNETEDMQISNNEIQIKTLKL